MSNKFQDKYRISSTRLQNWDYSWNALYFITICTKNKEHYFGEIKGEKMILSNIGTLADVFWHEIKNHLIFVELDAFVVMPNHIHGILAINNPVRKSEYIGNNADTRQDTGHAETRQKTRQETRHALSLQQIQSPQPLTQSQFENFQHQSSDLNKTRGQMRFQNQGKNSLSSILGSYKSAVTKHAHRLCFEFEWQSRFHDHIIRDAESFQHIRKYIDTNVMNWDSDKFYDRLNNEK